MVEITRVTSRKRKRRCLDSSFRARHSARNDKPRHRRLRFRLVTYLVLGLLLTSPAHAITTAFGDIEITPEPPPQGASSHGYFEYVFHVVNKSSERSYTVSLSIPFERSFLNGDSIRDLRRTVQVGAKETVHVSLLQPDYPPLGGTDVAVIIDGRRQEREVQLKPNETRSPSGFYRSGLGPRGSMGESLILLGPHVKPLPKTDPPPGGGMMGGPPPMPVGGLPMRAPGRRPPGGGGAPGMPAGAPPPEIEMPPGKPGIPPRGYQFVSPDTWSDNWLAYSRYDGILVTAAELNALPAGTRTALWQYVETGGALLVLGRTELRGLSAVAETKKDPAGWIEVKAGFGTCRVSPDADYDTWESSYFASLIGDWTKAAAVWQTGQRSTHSANQDFPIIDDLGIPIKGLFVLMFLFVLGIGPFNVFVLSRLKRRIWLLWTTPVFSLCTCLAVFGYMLLSEGWSGRLKSETLTLLDETTHRATTIGWTAIYSPLTPSDGLHFRYETEVIPQRYYYEDRRSGGRSCSIDWSQDQHFASGWVEARVPAHFKVRKSELRRERVALQHEPDGRWSIVNGLGAAIRHFWYADTKGQIYEAEDVAAGARVMLARTEKETPASSPIVQNTLSTNWMTKMKDFPQHPQTYLRPGLYLADVDGSPFLEVALPNAQTRKLHSFVVGFASSHTPGG